MTILIILKRNTKKDRETVTHVINNQVRKRRKK